MSTARLSCFLMLLVSACMTSADEVTHPIDAALQECLASKDNMNTAGMANCTYKAIEQWDQELDKTYRNLMKRLDDDSQETLKASQLAWIDHRESELKTIDSMYSNREGTMYIPMRAMSVLTIIKHRTEELDSYLSLYASDL